VSGGRLTPVRGTPVHAAAFLPKRLVILETSLRRNPSELKRIWLHELFHFVWWRLGNPDRRSWEHVLLRERSVGELGWSAEWRKKLLTAADRDLRTRKWREYCAESFCDTGAWIGLGSPVHPEATLAARAKQLRQRWWATTIRYNLVGGRSDKALDSRI
jgi:hypothetical protein